MEIENQNTIERERGGGGVKLTLQVGLVYIRRNESDQII